MPAKTARKTEKSKALWERRLRWVPKAPFHYTHVAVDRAQGARLWDVDGNEYIDFSGGISVLNVGHRHPKVVKAVRDQLEKLMHISFHVCNYEGYVDLAERLSKSMPAPFNRKAIFFNSGAEAVENAVKAAKAFTKRPNVVAFDLGFHGRTWMAVSLTGKYDPYRTGFGPFLPGVLHTPYPYPYRPPVGVRPEALTEYCLAELRRVLRTRTAPDQVAAVMCESVQGEGGLIVPDPEFLRGVRRICDEHGIVLIMDEVQAGMGRTGKLWGWEHAGVVPDLMTVGKSLGGGMPLTAVVGRADVLDAVHEGGMGGTYNGQPMACAAALAVFDVIEEEKLLERGVAMGRRIEERFKAMADRFPFVGDERGLGPFRGVELVKDKKTKEPITSEQAYGLLTACAERGLIILKAGLYNNVLRTMVPLVASDEELDRGLDVLETVLSGFKP